MRLDARMAALDALMREVLIRLELASHVSAASMDSDMVSHGKSQGNQPPRVGMPHLHYRHEYAIRRNDADRRVVIRDALNELRSIRYAKKGGHRDTREGRLIVGRDPRPVGIVAYSYGYSAKHVYRLRAEAKEFDRKSVRRPIRVNDTLSHAGSRAA